jgi:hypothetical protein
MKHDQELLNEYFSKIWIPGAGRGITSPETIVKKIKPEEWLLDVGCGKNPFKNLHIKTIGIDPAFDEADYKCTIEEFSNPFKFDVATCLGSINFGSIAIIEQQIDKVVSLLQPKSRIYWRLNPGRKDHGNEECNHVPFFPWTFEILNEFAVKHNYKQENETVDEHATRPRLYAEWIRS